MTKVTEKLRVIDPTHIDNFQTMQERSNRANRIDKIYAIDRGRVSGLILQRWSAEALECGELKHEAERAETTLTDRIEAWRSLFAKHAKH